MNPAIEGQVTCRVHLAATVTSLMTDGGALLSVRTINTTQSGYWQCTCMLEAEFHVMNVGKDEDEPFPLFRSL